MDFLSARDDEPTYMTALETTPGPPTTTPTQPEEKGRKTNFEEVFATPHRVTIQLVCSAWQAQHHSMCLKIWRMSRSTARASNL